MNNWDTNARVEETQENIFYPATEDLAVIAKHLRKLIGNIPGAVFSVRIDRARKLIRVEGAIKFWGEEYSTVNQARSELLLGGVLKDVAEEYQLEINEYMAYNRYSLVEQQ